MLHCVGGCGVLQQPPVRQWWRNADWDDWCLAMPIYYKHFIHCVLLVLWFWGPDDAHMYTWNDEHLSAGLLCFLSEAERTVWTRTWSQPIAWRRALSAWAVLGSGCSLSLQSMGMSCRKACLCSATVLVMLKNRLPMIAVCMGDVCFPKAKWISTCLETWSWHDDQTSFSCPSYKAWRRIIVDAVERENADAVERQLQTFGARTACIAWVTGRVNCMQIFCIHCLYGVVTLRIHQTTRLSLSPFQWRVGVFTHASFFIVCPCILLLLTVGPVLFADGVKETQKSALKHLKCTTDPPCRVQD